MGPSVWTDELVARVKDLIEVKGYSASEVSRELGGIVTRNAVIGKANRLKLVFKRIPVGGLNKRVRRAKPSLPRLLSSPPSAPLRRAQDVGLRTNKADIASRKNDEHSRVLQVVGPHGHRHSSDAGNLVTLSGGASVPSEADAHNVGRSKEKRPPYRATKTSEDCSGFRPLAEIGRFECRWPGEKVPGAGLDMPVCGKPVGPRYNGKLSMYCSHHHARAFQWTPPKYAPMTASKEEAQA